MLFLVLYRPGDADNCTAVRNEHLTIRPKYARIRSKFDADQICRVDVPDFGHPFAHFLDRNYHTSHRVVAHAAENLERTEFKTSRWHARRFDHNLEKEGS